MFKQEFKYYKSKNPLPDLKQVFNFYENKSKNSAKVLKLNITPNVHFFGLIPTNEWEIYELVDNPGLIFLKNPFTKLGERYWIVRCLKDFTKKPNKLNIDIHNLVPNECDWWDFSQGNSKLTDKLRWATLGYHHDWDTKVYTEDSKNPFPKDLNQLCIFIANTLGFTNFNAEAAIVNFYHLNSTLSGHTDHSEENLDAPLFSISFGQTAIFLLGGPTIDIKPSALFLQSGDIVIMSKVARLSYHGVPKILPSTTRTWDSDEDVTSESVLSEMIDKNMSMDCLKEQYWKPYKNYVKTSRININVRQVLKRGQKRLKEK